MMGDTDRFGVPPSALAPGSTLVAMDDALKRQWGEQPDASYDVVIVLRPDSETAPAALSAQDVEPIPYQPGMFKARLTGAELLALAERTEVEDIGPDEGVQAL